MGTDPANNNPKQGFAKGQSGNPKGRPKGTPNKITTALKDAILQAAAAAGGEEGLVGYLTTQASENPQSFLPLLGKVLPMQVQHEGAIRVERVLVEFAKPDAQ